MRSVRSLDRYISSCWPSSLGLARLPERIANEAPTLAPRVWHMPERKVLRGECNDSRSVRFPSLPPARYRRIPLRTHGRLPKRSPGGLLRHGRCLRPFMQTATRYKVYHQREGCYETRIGAHRCRITAGHRGVCQHDTPATTGLERWGDWRGRWGGPGGDHGRQSRPWGRHWWGRWGCDWGADQIAPAVRQAADAP
jgi:hypothetical protein